MSNHSQKNFQLLLESELAYLVFRLLLLAMSPNLSSQNLTTVPQLKISNERDSLIPHVLVSGVCVCFLDLLLFLGKSTTTLNSQPIFSLQLL